MDLLRKLTSRRVTDRYDALRAIAFGRRKTYAEHAVRLLRDPSRRVRDVAAWALGSLGDRRYAGPVSHLLRDRDLWTRCHAVEALGDMGAKRYASRISRLTRDPHWLVRGHAAFALGALEARNLSRRLAKLLRDPAPVVRGVAAWALARMNERRYLDRMIKLLGCPGALRGTVTGLNILSNHALYRKLRKRHVRVTNRDTLEGYLRRIARLGVKVKFDNAGRKWMKLPFMKYRRQSPGYDLYRAFNDVGLHFGPREMGFVIRGDTLVVTTMRRAVRELRQRFEPV